MYGKLGTNISYDPVPIFRNVHKYAQTTRKKEVQIAHPFLAVALAVVKCVVFLKRKTTVACTDGCRTAMPRSRSVMVSLGIGTRAKHVHP